MVLCGAVLLTLFAQFLESRVRLQHAQFAKNKEERLPLESAANKFKEVWCADNDMRKHGLVIYSARSGKSELLTAV